MSRLMAFATLEEGKRVKTIVKILLLACALIAPSLATAQEYPSRPVTVVIPFPPGGTNDVVGRYLADRLQEFWKQTVVVENRPGAGSAIGVAYVTRARADGYTMMFVSSSFTTNAATQKNLPFDPVKDLQPVGIVALGDQFVIAGTRVTISSLKDLQNQAKTRQIFYATTGVGANPHFAGELLNDILGIKMQAVHYRGGAPAMTDLRGGRVDLYFGTAPEVAMGVGTPLAVMSEKRSPAFPAVPTVAEAGFPDALFGWWGGVFAPAGTPKDLVAKINQDILTVMSSKQASEFLAQQGFRPPTKMSVDQFSEFVKREIANWTSLAKKHDIVVE